MLFGSGVRETGSEGQLGYQRCERCWRCWTCCIKKDIVIKGPKASASISLNLRSDSAQPWMYARLMLQSCQQSRPSRAFIIRCREQTFDTASFQLHSSISASPEFCEWISCRLRADCFIELCPSPCGVGLGVSSIASCKQETTVESGQTSLLLQIRASKCSRLLELFAYSIDLYLSSKGDQTTLLPTFLKRQWDQ